MPFVKLLPKPGINTQRTQTLNEGGWSVANLVRFREGLPEVIGGWTAFAQATVQGVCRKLHAWVTLSSIDALGIGTHLRLYVAEGGQPYDVTPVVQTTTPNNPFTTTVGQSIVLVTDAGISGLGLTVDSFVEISGATAVNGITLSGEYTVLTVPSTTTYTVQAAGTAAGSGAGGGTPTIGYLLPAGTADELPSVGYGVGAYGAGTYGTPRSSSAGEFLPSLWTLDHWGENLIACRRDFGVYQWQPSLGLATRAAALSGAPAQAKGAIVAAPAQILIAYGCAPPSGGAQDPMLVAWCDVGSNTTWTPTATNQAGSYRLTDGSQIMIAHRAHQMILLHTDTALFAMQYIGTPLIWSFSQVGAACGLIAPNAAAFLGGIEYWWGLLNFWMFDGTAKPIDCPVRDIVFKNINAAQIGKVFAAVNSQWGEIWWFYPSADAIEVDSYVVVNTQTLAADPASAWSYGTLSRTAWIDGSVFGNPIATDATGAIWSHETGYSAAGAAMPFAVESGYLDIAEGEQFGFIDLVIPDQVLDGGPIAYTFYVTRYPGDTPQVFGPYQVMPTTEFIAFRARGRQIAWRIDNSYSVPDTFWRLGAARARIAPDGRL